MIEAVIVLAGIALVLRQAISGRLTAGPAVDHEIGTEGGLLLTSLAAWSVYEVGPGLWSAGSALGLAAIAALGFVFLPNATKTILGLLATVVSVGEFLGGSCVSPDIGRAVATVLVLGGFLVVGVAFALGLVRAALTRSTVGDAVLAAFGAVEMLVFAVSPSGYDLTVAGLPWPFWVSVAGIVTVVGGGLVLMPRFTTSLLGASLTIAAIAIDTATGPPCLSPGIGVLFTASLVVLVLLLRSLVPSRS